MRRRLFFWELAGFLFTGALGVLLHFLYEWSGGNTLAAAFSAVNESTWEHMKLLFFPMFVFSVFQVCIMGRNYPNFLAARAASILTGLVLFPVRFYTSTGGVGGNILGGASAICVLADLGALGLDAWLLRRGKLTAPWQQILGLLILWAVAFCFVWCTFRPVKLALWMDPVTGTFGA